MRFLVLAGALVLLAGGGVAGWIVARETQEAETVTTTTTTTETTTATPETGLPKEVERTRAALIEAAESGDYEALRALVPATGFEYTFGGPVEGGPIAYWQELERRTDERPLETLAVVLRMPYTLSRGIYVWPFAYDVPEIAELSRHERTLLSALGDLDTLFFPGTGYLGWRAGIQPDGSWVFFVAGD